MARDISVVLQCRSADLISPSVKEKIMSISFSIGRLPPVAPLALHIANAAPKSQMAQLLSGIKSALFTASLETRSPLSGCVQKTFGGNIVPSKGMLATFFEALKKVFTRGAVHTGEQGNVRKRATVQSPRTQLDAVKQLVKKQVDAIKQMKLEVEKIDGRAADKRSTVVRNIPERSAAKPVATAQELTAVMKKAKELPHGEQRQQEMQKIKSALNELKRSARPVRSANAAYARQQRGAAELNKLDAEIIKTGRATELWSAENLPKQRKNS